MDFPPFDIKNEFHIASSNQHLEALLIEMDCRRKCPTILKRNHTATNKLKLWVVIFEFRREPLNAYDEVGLLGNITFQCKLYFIQVRLRISEFVRDQEAAEDTCFDLLHLDLHFFWLDDVIVILIFEIRAFDSVPADSLKHIL